MILLEDEFNGKPIFKVNFIDFCNLVCRDERRTKFVLNNEALMEHIKKTRYSKNYVIEYNGIKYFPAK
ncbi:MAG: hypothetical protein M0R17_00145 [Candidatus Omnitrophica bacterium]|jgi:hypothetical protein|nr:hypothetical protein [Candidatus Omnitrophota bacterium]